MIHHRTPPPGFLSDDNTVDGFTSDGSILLSGRDDITGEGCTLRVSSKIARDLSAWLESTANILEGRGADFYLGDYRVIFSTAHALAAWITHRGARVELHASGPVWELHAFIPEVGDEAWEARYRDGDVSPDATVASTDCGHFTELLAIAQRSVRFRDVGAVLGERK